MYVTRRPDIREGPFYAVLPSVIGMLTNAAIPIINPGLPPIGSSACRPDRGAAQGIKSRQSNSRSDHHDRYDSATLETMCDGFIQATHLALGFIHAIYLTLVIFPVVYALFPPRTRETQVDDSVPSPGSIVTGALIRASVLMA